MHKTVPTGDSAEDNAVIRKEGKIANYLSRKEKAQKTAENKERRRLLAEATAESEIELARRLAQKHGLTVISGIAASPGDPPDAN